MSDDLSADSTVESDTDKASASSISKERQRELIELYKCEPNAIAGIYPLSGIHITRSDLEWMLANLGSVILRATNEIVVSAPATIELHEPGMGMTLRSLLGSSHDDDGYHSYSWLENNEQRTRSLDLRGADISGEDLTGLNLSNVCAGIWEVISDSSLQWDEELIQKAAVSFQGSIVSNVNLDGAVLVGADFRRVRGVGTSFTAADARYVNFEAAHLMEANFSWANLSGSNITAANFRDSRFSQAILGGVQGTRAGLYRSYFEGAVLNNSRHGYISRSEPADLQGADLTDSRLEGAVLGDKLAGSDLSRALLGGAVFAGGILTKVDLSHTDLTRCSFDGADLREANFRGAVLGDSSGRSSMLGSEPPKDRPDLAAQIPLMDRIASGDFSEKLPEPTSALARIKTWLPDFPPKLQPTDLRGCFFDASTRLDGVIFCNHDEAVFLEGVHWGEADVSVINWESVKFFGRRWRQEEL